jgi:hypothetical protein
MVKGGLKWCDFDIRRTKAVHFVYLCLNGIGGGVEIARGCEAGLVVISADASVFRRLFPLIPPTRLNTEESISGEGFWRFRLVNKKGVCRRYHLSRFKSSVSLVVSLNGWIFKTRMPPIEVVTSAL